MWFFNHNHVHVFNVMMKTTIDITTVVVQWVPYIIVPLFDTIIIVLILEGSIYSDGTISQLPSATHIGFWVLTWPSDFIQSFFVVLQVKHVIFYSLHSHNVMILLDTVRFCKNSAPKHVPNYTSGMENQFLYPPLGFIYVFFTFFGLANVHLSTKSH